MDQHVGHSSREPASGARSAPQGPLRQHAAFIVVFILSATLTALALTYVYSERYAASTTIFFKPANVLKLSENQVQALGSPVPTTPFKVINQTLTGLASSDTLLREVVLDLSLQVPEPKVVSPIWYIRLYKEAKDWVEEYAADAWSYLKFGRIIVGDPVDKAIAEVRKGLKIASEDSYVSTLSMRAKTAEAAAAIANDIATRLGELLRQGDRDAAMAQQGQLDSLIAGKVDEITRIERAIADLLAANHIAAVDADVERSTYRHAQLELSHAQSKADLTQQQARLAGLADQLRRQSPNSLASRSGDDINLRRRAEQLNADQYAKLSAEELTTDVAVSGLRALNSSMERSLDELDEHLRQLTDIQATHDLLWQQLTAAKRDYAALRDSLAEQTIRHGDGQSELHVTSMATPNDAPVSPIKIYHAGLAALVAAMLAYGLAFVLGYFDIRLFVPRQRGSRPDLGQPDRGQPDRSQVDRGQVDRGQPDRAQVQPAAAVLGQP